MTKSNVFLVLGLLFTLFGLASIHYGLCFVFTGILLIVLSYLYFEENKECDD